MTSVIPAPPTTSTVHDVPPPPPVAVSISSSTPSNASAPAPTPSNAAATAPPLPTSASKPTSSSTTRWTLATLQAHHQQIESLSGAELLKTLVSFTTAANKLAPELAQEIQAIVQHCINSTAPNCTKMVKNLAGSIALPHANPALTSSVSASTPAVASSSAIEPSILLQRSQSLGATPVVKMEIESEPQSTTIATPTATATTPLPLVKMEIDSDPTSKLTSTANSTTTSPALKAALPSKIPTSSASLFPSTLAVSETKSQHLPADTLSPLRTPVSSSDSPNAVKKESLPPSASSSSAAAPSTPNNIIRLPRLPMVSSSLFASTSVPRALSAIRPNQPPGAAASSSSAAVTSSSTPATPSGVVAPIASGVYQKRGAIQMLDMNEAHAAMEPANKKRKLAAPPLSAEAKEAKEREKLEAKEKKLLSKEAKEQEKKAISEMKAKEKDEKMQAKLEGARLKEEEKERVKIEKEKMKQGTTTPVPPTLKRPFSMTSTTSTQTNGGDSSSSGSASTVATTPALSTTATPVPAIPATIPAPIPATVPVPLPPALVNALVTSPSDPHTMSMFAAWQATQPQPKVSPYGTPAASPMPMNMGLLAPTLATATTAATLASTPTLAIPTLPGLSMSIPTMSGMPAIPSPSNMNFMGMNHAMPHAHQPFFFPPPVPTMATAPGVSSLPFFQPPQMNFGLPAFNTNGMNGIGPTPAVARSGNVPMVAKTVSSLTPALPVQGAVQAMSMDFTSPSSSTRTLNDFTPPVNLRLDTNSHDNSAAGAVGAINMASAASMGMNLMNPMMNSMSPLNPMAHNNFMRSLQMPMPFGPDFTKFPFSGLPSPANSTMSFFSSPSATPPMMLSPTNASIVAAAAAASASAGGVPAGLESILSKSNRVTPDEREMITKFLAHQPFPAPPGTVNGVYQVTLHEENDVTDAKGEFASKETTILLMNLTDWSWRKIKKRTKPRSKASHHNDVARSNATTPAPADLMAMATSLAALSDAAASMTAAS